MGFETLKPLNNPIPQFSLIEPSPLKVNSKPEILVFPTFTELKPKPNIGSVDGPQEPKVNSIMLLYSIKNPTKSIYPFHLEKVNDSTWTIPLRFWRSIWLKLEIPPRNGGRTEKKVTFSFLF